MSGVNLEIHGKNSDVGMGYIYINTPLLSWIVAQSLKLVFQNIKKRRLSWDLFLCSGGMPSAHSASTSSLATILGIIRGFDSPEFAIAGLFCFVVMYDARGVRYASGKQASYLNILLSELRDEIASSDELDELEVLKTEIGHSMIQVLAGCLIGVSVALLIGFNFN